MVVLKYYFSTQNTKKHAALVALRLKILAPKHSKLPKIIAYCSYKVIKKNQFFYSVSLFLLKIFFCLSFFSLQLLRFSLSSLFFSSLTYLLRLKLSQQNARLGWLRLAVLWWLLRSAMSLVFWVAGLRWLLLLFPFFYLFIFIFFNSFFYGLKSLCCVFGYWLIWVWVWRFGFGFGSLWWLLVWFWLVGTMEVVVGLWSRWWLGCFLLG